ncbi:hydroxyethylthiazole kinase [Bifidobacterium animalis subsp. animalis MCC 0483]|uniref:Hydroxyethylthiazole kinase n=1 Tax=Bifidobacterium animalis subsp. animalis MCC 0483 TaxID=1365955 RepID=A0AB34T882_9BIFI|nr:hydroxyethylthiazole kinase [Bifidobacterium animalis]KOA48970.1 hydroxyethylthiazole kinase [Bifidobacterium animalis subsp. animalis MCC 0483]KOA62233.1 hydroxyethylthiazole kinase [Bifidobacterium animalis subsp. animalis MCC 0499]MCR1995608.1 hydroxyethylthiazole kinase [Bifidobacterium animalis subsp. animalis]
MTTASTTPNSGTSNLHEVAPDDPIRERIRQAAQDVREQTPLAQSFTNFVTINLVANAQLAAGGTAAMSFLPNDVTSLASSCGATYINVGTLLPFYRDALQEISEHLSRHGCKWVLDPVAAGVGVARTEILEGFKDYPPTVIRANASEALVLHDMWQLGDAAGTDEHNGPAGVEAADSVDAAITAATGLAAYLALHSPTHTGAVAVSGEVDLVTDGRLVYRLPGGSAMMTKITGAGCSLGGVTATYLAVADPLVASLAASMLYNVSSEAAERASHGPGSFQTAFLDALWNVTPEEIASAPLYLA